MLKSHFVLLLVLTATIASAGEWQQEVRYSIAVRLNTRDHALTGTERLWYRNNSPDTLNYVWIHMYPNAYRDRTTVFGQELEAQNNYEFSFAPVSDRGYIELHRLEVNGHESFAYQWKRNDGDEFPDMTEMRINLFDPVAPGDTLILFFDFTVKIPKFFSRLGHRGRHYVISQWYPKIAVYDDASDSTHGVWHPDSYHAVGEFYGEFGTFDVAITLPEDMVVGATGNLIEVIKENSKTELSSGVEAEVDWTRRLPSERRKQMKDSEKRLKTLRFRAENVHDFAWVADPEFVLVQDSVEIPAPNEPRSRVVVINVLMRESNRKRWQDVPQIACRALNHFSQHYGSYPYRQLTVADAGLAAGGGMEYPNLVVIATAAMPFAARLFEQVVVHEIGHQWFYGLIGTNEMAEAWLDEGINTFAEIRYFEEIYGTEANLVPANGFFSGLSNRYYHRMVYELAATNNLLKPILTPAWEFVKTPIAYAGVQYAQAAFVVDMLRRQVGDSLFDRIVQAYCQRFRYRHPNSKDFIQVVEEVTGQSWSWFFDQWLTSAQTCDYAVAGIRRTDGCTEADIVRRGGIQMPVEVRARFADGSSQTEIAGSRGTSRIETVVFYSDSRLVGIELDPERKLLETNRWNNYVPRRVEVRPVFDLPSFDSYQLFYGPYAWWDDYHGVQVGPWLMGRQFIEAGPLHGKHQWVVSTLYRTKLNNYQVNMTYNTPLSFISEKLKWGTHGNASETENGIGADLSYHIGRVFSPVGADFRLEYRLTDLKQMRFLERRDFDSTRIAHTALTASGAHVSRSWQGNGMVSFAVGSQLLGGKQDYLRLALEASETWRLSRGLRARCRFFTGLSGGNLPKQEQFFLSGGLRSNDAQPLNWSNLGGFSSQEHWHIEGDANLPGYIGEHRKGKIAASFSLSLGTKFFSPFFGIGNVADSWNELRQEPLRMNAGVRLTMGPLYAILPVWASRPESGKPFAFRWTLGLTLSGVNVSGL